MDWTGTWLQAVWIVRSQRLAEWRKLLDVWSCSSVLDHGTALLVAVPPEAATHRSLENPDFLPELHWTGNRQVALDALSHNFPVRLDLALRRGPGISELRVSSIVNRDDSLSLYLSVPLNLFESVDDAVSRQRFADFLTVCSELFAPEVVLAGTIGEEAQLHGLDALEREIARWTGRAFYGDELAAQLTAPRLAVPEPSVRTQLQAGGLFVAWAEWPEWREAPLAWRQAVLGILKAHSDARP
jgi:hypothetical protein